MLTLVIRSTVEAYFAFLGTIALGAILLRERQRALARLDARRYAPPAPAAGYPSRRQLMLIAVVAGPAVLWVTPHVSSLLDGELLVALGVLALVAWGLLTLRRRAWAFSACTPRQTLALPLLAFGSAWICIALGAMTGAVNLHITTDDLAAQPAPGAPLFDFRFESAVTLHQQSVIRAGIAGGEDFYQRTFGAAVQRPVIIEVRATRPASASYEGITYGHHILMYANDDNRESYSDYELEDAAAHELFHVLQNELSGGRADAASPDWLIEGSADEAADAMMADSGWVDAGEIASCRLWLLHPEAERVPPLQALAPAGAVLDRNGYYALAAIATDDLSHRAGLAALGRYFALLASDPPDNAFQAAFGAGLTEFYQEFSEVRTALSSPDFDACGYEYQGGS